jgi:hypothetical protein
MNKICGKVLVKETRVGIPDLLVEIYDVDPGTRPEEIFRVGSNSDDVVRNPELPTDIGFRQSPTGDRIGSVLTDASGWFELTYEDGEFRRRNAEEQRPDLLLAIAAPEESALEPSKGILYFSKEVRQGAGLTETYIIRIPASQLQSAGIPIPKEPDQEEPESSKLLLAKMSKAIKLQDEIQTGVDSLRTQRIIQERQRVQAVENNFQAIVQAMSSVPADRMEALNYVRPGESVEAVNHRVIANNISVKINNPRRRAPITGHLLLTEAQKEALQSFQGPDGNFVDVPSDVMAPILFGGNGQPQQPAFLVSENPLAQLCRQKIDAEKDAELCLGLQDEESETSGDTGSSGVSSNSDETDFSGNGLEPATPEDIPKYITKLMENVAAPEEPVVFGVTARATQGDVQYNVDHFSLKGGPADAPSYHDFHNLQIAFEHVWQEAIDQGALDVAKDLYEQVVELGGDPRAGIQSGRNPLDALRSEVLNVLNAEQTMNDSEQIYPIQAQYRRSRRSGATTVRDHTKGSKGLLDRVTDGTRDWVDDVLDWLGGDDKPSKRFPSPNDGSNSSNERVPSRPGPGSVLDLLSQLNQRLKEKYAFTIYAPNSVNFGILVTYRQRWDPTGYQAGELVKTIPLAPKEMRKFSVKRVIKKLRKESEVDKSLRSRREESSETSRAEAEIIRKAEAKTNFSLSASGTFNVDIAIGSSKGTQTTTTGKDTSKISEDVKKDFFEAVFKASQEYKLERTLEVNTEESEEFEFQESGEINNPNDELAVTYLFYELQRRYRVSEHIHRLTPVILVAQEVPNPADIDHDWLIAHDWILRRVLLDDSFLPALAYVSTKMVGDKLALSELQKNVTQQRQVVADLKDELGAIRDQVKRRYIALAKAISRQAGGLDDDETLLERAVDLVVPSEAVSKVADFFFGGSDEDDKEAARIRREAAEEAYDQALREERDVRGRLDREISALNSITATYAKALSEHYNHKVEILRLLVHCKDNILYYMQAIWSHEPPDQRFFRLHKVSVPVLEGETKYTLELNPDLLNLKYLAARQFGVHGTVHQFEAKPELKPEFKTVTLAEVADLDNLLGFKGNYAIFPLKQSNALTEFMMAPYIDNALGTLIDPDELGNWTLADFAKYVCCLKKTLPPEEFNDELKAQLREQYKRLLTAPLRNTEEIIVPTDSLFIEALPGKHPILEDFKLMHRAIDVKKVQAEVRDRELENIRLSARLLSGQLDDADIEKKIVIEGNPSNISISDGNDT